MRYLVERMDKGEAPLQDAIREDYVRRDLSRDEVRRVVSHPEFVRAARERPGEPFGSEQFRIWLPAAARPRPDRPWPSRGRHAPTGAFCGAGSPVDWTGATRTSENSSLLGTRVNKGEDRAFSR